ncbi:MAG: PD-(D/E)XK nuclease family protein [Bacilli bacterium]|nr:PD-(D/E)XK nuclease family protein [Bacilli bacterium]
MDIYKYLNNNSILIIPNNLKDVILKKINENPIINIKIMTLNDLKRKILFDFDAQTIYFVMKEKALSYRNALEIIKNLYFLSDKIDNQKLKELSQLKSKLDEKELLIYDHYFLKSLINKKVVFLGFDYLYKLDYYLINKIKLITEVEIIFKNNNNYSHNILKFNNINEEIEYVAKEILIKIKKGININNILLANYNKEYSLTINRIFTFYKIPINLDDSIFLYDTTVGLNILNNLNNYEDILSGIQDLNIYNAVIEIFNNYYFIDDFSTIKEILIEEFKSKRINKDRYKDAVNLVDIKNNFFDDDKHIFLIGFVDKLIPTIYKDDNFINDQEKNELLESTEELNKIEKVIWEEAIKNIKHLTITYSIEDLKEICFPSSIAGNMRVDCQNYEVSIFSHQSNKYNLGILLDIEKKYGKREPELLKLYNNYRNLNYLSYNNQYNGINPKLLRDKYTKLTLSYTKLNTYYECNFKYYLEYILKLSDYEVSFDAYLGSLCHHILSKIYNEHFDFIEEKESFLRNNHFDLTPGNYAFIDKMCEDLIFAIDFIKEHYENTLFKKVECEKNVKINIGSDKEIIFNGIIDKIMVYENKATIIDYKTYAPNIDLSLIPYGLGLQLPIYIYLTISAYPNAKIAGIYLQNINRNIIVNNDKNDLEKIKRDNLKLVGYTLDNETIINEIDSTYKDSRFIKGMKITSKGFYKYTKLLSEDDFEEIFKLAREKIKDGAEDILNAKFEINPKIVDKTNVSCEYCKYKSICFMRQENQIYLNKDKNLTFLKEVDD